MAVKTVAILSPGDMGHAVGRALGEHGLNVITCLAGRSERTRSLAQQGNIRDVPSLEEVVSQADLVLSILVPSEAKSVAQQVSEALRATGADTYFADCNAVSPETTSAMNDIITTAGGRYIDASIIGGPPAKNSPRTRFYVSGAHSSFMSELDCDGVTVRPLGDAIGRASGIKMCYAAMTKGTSALYLALLSAAEAMGLSDELAAEFKSSQSDTYKRMEGGLPSLPSKAFRWVGEMEEIASTFEHLGVTPFFHRGAAEMYRLLSETPFAQETPETIDENRTLKQTISVIAEHLPSGVQNTD
ncbi:MAG: NAD(P)-dependent oxidoreductase [Chloroflexi bacterium]|nr:NAD(P)-dependent oxidoreductase [Chloroflexota bacterium]